MEVRDQQVDDAELVAGRDEEIGPPGVCPDASVDASRRFERTHDRRADGDDASALLPCRRDALGKALAAAALERGLIVRVTGSSVVIAPPLIITDDEITELFERFERALEDAERVA